MGFETMIKISKILNQPSFEVSLWDLKLSIVSGGGHIHLKYPYGIWNDAEVSITKNLKDLKYPYGIWN